MHQVHLHWVGGYHPALPAPHILQVAKHRLATNGRVLQQAQHAQCRDGFARAGFTHQGHTLPRLDFEVDPVHHFMASKGDAQVLHVKKRCLL